MKNKKRKAVLLDRDGVINVDHGYVYKIKNFEFEPGAIDALKMLSSTDYLMIIITSQSGIGRGYYTIEDYKRLTEHMMSIFKKEGIRIDAIYYCPHAPEENCRCRKPGTKLIDDAERDFSLDLTRSYIIGDKTSDIKMGEEVNSKTILVKTGKGGRDRRCRIRPDHVADNLLEAVKIIVGESK